MRELLESYKESLGAVSIARARAKKRGTDQDKADMTLLSSMEDDLLWTVEYMATGYIPPYSEHKRLPKTFPVDPELLSLMLQHRRPVGNWQRREEVSLKLRGVELSERERDFYWLAKACDWSLRDIAEEHGVSYETVRKVLKRAEAKMRGGLTACG